MKEKSGDSDLQRKRRCYELVDRECAMKIVKRVLQKDYKI